MAFELPPKELIEFLGGRDDFQKFLQTRVISAQGLRMLVEAATEGKGEKYSAALQDAINRIGELLGFKVRYGDYKQGPDGIWQSPSGRFIVVETRTSTSFRMKPETLLGYISDVVSESKISKKNVLGLYVVGRPGEDTAELEDSIRGSQRQDELRVITAHQLISLLEVKEQANLDHEAVLVFLPVDLVNLGTLIEQVRSILSKPPPEPEGGRPPVKRPRKRATMRSLLEKGIIKPEMTFIARYKGKDYQAVVTQQGNLRYGKEEYPTPSAAGRAVINRSCDGWFFWKYKDPQTGDLQPIAKLRAKLTGGMKNSYLKP
jgi:hypothetical protein